MIWLAESVMQPVSYNRISRILIDNGLLSLQLLDCESILLENQVALSLFRKYGHDEEGTQTDAHGSIEIVPCWKWLLEIES